jgi:hypothetical protein
MTTTTTNREDDCDDDARAAAGSRVDHQVECRSRITEIGIELFVVIVVVVMVLLQFAAHNRSGRGGLRCFVGG